MKLSTHACRTSMNCLYHSICMHVHCSSLYGSPSSHIINFGAVVSHTNCYRSVHQLPSPEEMKVSTMICAPLKKSPNCASQITRCFGLSMLKPYSNPSTASSLNGLLATWNNEQQRGGKWVDCWPPGIMSNSVEVNGWTVGARCMTVVPSDVL